MSYSYVDSITNSEHTLLSIWNVILNIIICYNNLCKYSNPMPSTY